MRLLTVIGQAASLARVAGTVSATYGVGRLAAARQARGLRCRRAFTYEEALKDGLLDPEVPERDRLHAVSKHLMLEIQFRVNPRELFPLTEEKAIFYLACEAAGLPVPRLYGVVGREAGWAGSRALDAPEAFARIAATELPEHFVVKPSAGYHGDGISLMRREGDRLIDHHGEAMTAEELYARLRGDRRFGLYVIQERVHNHPDITARFETKALQTLRLMTYVDAAGEPRLLYGIARIATGGGAVDNLADGRYGNCYSVISLEDGRLGRPETVGRAIAPMAPLPDSSGFAVPGWAEARDLALRAALAVLPLRAIGWDVAVTPAGPVLIEANAAFDPWPGADFGLAMEVIGTE